MQPPILLRLLVAAGLASTVTGCGADQNDQAVLDDWCRAAEEAVIVGADVYGDPDADLGAEQQADADEAGRRWFTLPAPEEIEPSVTILLEGPPEDDPGAYEDAASQLADFVEDNCDVPDEYFEPAPS